MSNKTYLLPFLVLLLLFKNSLGQTHEKTVLKSFNFKLYYTEGGHMFPLERPLKTAALIKTLFDDLA